MLTIGGELSGISLNEVILRTSPFFGLRGIWSCEARRLSNSALRILIGAAGTLVAPFGELLCLRQRCVGCQSRVIRSEPRSATLIWSFSRLGASSQLLQFAERDISLLFSSINEESKAETALLR